MKKIFGFLIIFLLVISLTACKDKEKQKEEEKETEVTEKTDSEKFKEEYESLNGTENSSGKEIRSIEISDSNPFIYKNADDIVDYIEDKETFLVYFGFASCPWCRSVVPTMIEVAKDYNIEKIYYVDVLNIRDVMELDDKDKAVTKTEGTDGYYKLIKKLDNVLSDYTLTNEDGKTIKTGEKRIYAPNLVVVIDGKAKKLTTGISEKQNDAYMKLTDEMKKDSYKQFEKVIKEYQNNSATCDKDGNNAC